MLEPCYFYLCPDPDDGWILHKKGCYVLEFEEEKLFIGSLYTAQQALTVARIRCSPVVYCSDCLINKSHRQLKKSAPQKAKSVIAQRHFNDDKKK